MGATANCASCKLHFYASLPRTCGDAWPRSYLWLARSSTASRCCSNIASRELIEEPPPLSFRNASSDTLHSTVTPLAASLIGKAIFVQIDLYYARCTRQSHKWLPLLMQAQNIIRPHHHHAKSSAALSFAKSSTRYGVDSFASLSTHKHGDWAVGQDLSRLAAHKKFGDPASAVRSHDNEIAGFRLGGFNDAFGGILILHMHGLASQALFPPGLADGSKDPLRIRFGRLIIRSSWDRSLPPSTREALSL